MCKEGSKLEKRKKIRIKYFVGSQECGVSQQNHYILSTEICKTYLKLVHFVKSNQIML